MGELVRRLEYERRSRSNALMTNKSSMGQNISKEYSNAVRSANEMEDRKRDIYIQRNNIHRRIFLNRFEYEKKIVEQFRSDLDFKSQEFQEDKFQSLRRAQSADARLQTFTGRKKKQTRKRKVSELLPRKYYEDPYNAQNDETEDMFERENSVIVKTGDSERKSSVSSGLFGLISKAKYIHHVKDFKRDASDDPSVTQNKDTDGSVSTSTSEPGDITIPAADTNGNVNDMSTYNRRRDSVAPTGLVTISESDRPKPKSAVPWSRKDSIINVNPRALSASAVRQAAPPPASLTALIPRDPKLPRRKSFPSTISDDDDVNDAPADASRSFRLLREAFQKVKIEYVDPSKERLEIIKQHNRNDSIRLRKGYMDRFKDIFVSDVFISLRSES